MNTMTYRGYAARIEYSDEDQCLVGHIIGIHAAVAVAAEVSGKRINQWAAETFTKAVQAS